MILFYNLYIYTHTHRQYIRVTNRSQKTFRTVKSQQYVHFLYSIYSCILITYFKSFFHYCWTFCCR